MLISFQPNGEVEFTRHPELLKLFEGEHKSIKRMTDIRHDEECQYFYILFLLGPEGIIGRTLAAIPGTNLMGTLWSVFAREHSPGLVHDLVKLDGWLVTFKTYEDAVKVEVAFIDFFREQGYMVE